MFNLIGRFMDMFEAYSTFAKSLWLLRRQITACQEWLDGVDCWEVKPSNEAVEDCKYIRELCENLAPDMQKLVDRLKKDLNV